MSQGYRPYVADEVVIGEGVALEVPVVPVAGRIGAGLVDLLASGLLTLALGYGVSRLAHGQSEIVVQTLVTLVAVLVLVVGPVVLETRTQGRTLGKALFGQRVVRDDGGPVTARHALTRALVGIVEKYAFLGVPAVTSSYLAPKSKRLGDLAAGTVVVSQRLSLQHLPPPGMPPYLAPWAMAADIAALPPGLALAIRQFLGRAGGLTPSSRQVLGQELLAATLPLVSPAPPPAPAEVVLAAVLAERRRRDAERIARDQRRRAQVLPGDSLGRPT